MVDWRELVFHGLINTKQVKQFPIHMYMCFILTNHAFLQNTEESPFCFYIKYMTL